VIYLATLRYVAGARTIRMSIAPDVTSYNQVINYTVLSAAGLPTGILTAKYVEIGVFQSGS